MENGKAIPLCVDLDGTLVHSDTLHENVIRLCATDPRHLVAIPGWLRRGRSALKQEVAERTAFDAASLPYRETVLQLIKEAKATGRPVVLATAAPPSVATAVADHLGLFDEILTSDANTNLTAARKAALLEERYGRQGFDYVGDCRADLPIFEKARRAYLVNPRQAMRRAASRSNPQTDFLDEDRGGPKAWAKLLRVHQWLKNLLVFVPLIAAHRFAEPALLVKAALAFVAFSLCASSVYILNDVLDLPADRAHRTKKKRPIASGQISVAAALVMAPVLLALSLLIGAVVSYAFLAVLLGYYALTSLYSFWLKRQVVVDVLILTILYTTRIVAGGAATGIPLSFWILAFSIFVFLSLALVKRYSELQFATEGGRDPAGRGYRAADLPVLLSLGSGSGLVSVLVLALYIQSEEIAVRYPASEWLWLPPLFTLYWITRLWMKANRGEVHDDPVIFAARDWQSLVIAALIFGSFLLAAVGPRL